MKKSIEQPKQWNYKDWYDQHSDELSEKRRSRYKADPDYRQRVLEQNRAYRQKKAAEQAERPRPRIRIPKHRKPVVFTVAIGGKQVPMEFVHIGTFARMIQRSVPTIHQWERLGLLPRTPFSLQGKAKQERLYTASMIQTVRLALDKRNGTVSSTDKSFFTEVSGGWRASGVDLDTPVAVSGGGVNA